MDIVSLIIAAVIMIVIMLVIRNGKQLQALKHKGDEAWDRDMFEE